MLIKNTILCLILLLIRSDSFGQKKVAITLDDVPNTTLFEENNLRPVLLNRLDSLQIPIAIFINESKIFKTNYLVENYKLLNNWASKSYITIGNHTYSHARYSETGLENYKEEILKGEYITKELADFYDKPLRYFRFPYNDLGLDSLQQVQIRNYLDGLNYVIAPFTVESSDWVYNYAYRYYLTNGDFVRAKKIGQHYVESTLELFEFYENLSQAEYGRMVSQIYLCHDNALNAAYLPQLIEALRGSGYTFISMADAMEDKAYTQENCYYKKWGISWFYRWAAADKRKELMMDEPALEWIYNLYEELQNKSK